MAENLERAALGTLACIGDIYDARSDNFSRSSIFKDSFSEDLLSVTDCFSSDVNIVQSDDLCEKLSKLDVNGDLQVSLLAGLFPLENAISSILHGEAISRTIKCSLIYRIKTKDEKLNMDRKDLEQYFSTENIPSILATHFVTGITWGVNLILSLSFENSKNGDAQKIEEKLVATLRKVSSAVLNPTLEVFDESRNIEFEKFQMQLYCDIHNEREKYPSNLMAILKFMKEIPDLLKLFNDGKGQPVIYHLTPLTLLQDHFNLGTIATITYKALDSITIARVIHVLNELASIQQQLNDNYQNFRKFWYCVREKDNKSIQVSMENFEIRIMSFKSKLSSSVIGTRSGTMEITELQNIMKETESYDHIFQQIKTFMGNHKSLFEKINLARLLVRSGVKYIGSGASLDEEILRHFDHKAFVFFFTQTSGKEDAERWKENRRLFFQHLRKNPKNVNFFAVDCAIHPNLMPNGYHSSSCIQILQSGRVITEDVLEEKSKLQSIPRAQATQEPEKHAYLPKKRVPLSIPCTGVDCNPQELYNWACKKCGEILQYGFDFHVYCACGKLPASCLEFKCPDIKHGVKFQTYTDIEYLNQQLEQIQLPQEINILILGETGVGKSTWINGFINYLSYGSIEEAQTGELLTLIPSEFTVCNPTPDGFEQIIVQTGQDKNEVFKSGQSATQTTKVYPIPIGNTTVRLIDTPGIGDTRGIEQDKKNFQNILTTLSFHDEIHGICILLKPNSARLTIMFRFCIKELLTYLHRDASKNIVFCFTNSRSTLYKPGDTFPALNTLLKENKEVEIVVSPNTVYCFDSEAYRFLAAMKNDPPVLFDEGEKENFAKSWERSIIETKRMLKYISSLKPHPIRDTLNLNHAREMVLKLTRPLAEISRNIQTNKANLNHELEEIEKTDENISELKKNKFTTITEIQSQPVDHPKTVCAHGNCVKVWKIGNITTNEYVQVCHDQCQLNDVQRDSLGDPGLMQCWALHHTGGQSCRVCGHDYKIHLHVYYDSIQVPKQVEDQAVKEALKNKLDAKQMKKNMISLRKTKIEKFEAEQKEIEKASAKFAYFLRKNAITPYNDELEQYLSHLIREEKDKVAQGGNVKALECLELSMSSYIEEKRILESEMSKEGGEGEGLNPREVEQLVEKLKGLELTGTSLKEALECVDKTRLVVYREEMISPRMELFGKKQMSWGFWERSKTKAKQFFGVWFSK